MRFRRAIGTTPSAINKRRPADTSCCRPIEIVCPVIGIACAAIATARRIIPIIRVAIGDVRPAIGTHRPVIVNILRVMPDFARWIFDDRVIIGIARPISTTD